ncbi:cytochrome P450 [Wolfiporia cocos MD-104 SS10]|uniref:Cytochrome P450 n=1 Tax=Wolfiporia cocos (strain MD-104) TaxID=742152 RepID=A0A2H3JKI2_WOLCO|nr:cytochrome P450 [Wolfiporia cocos MD-104 SS10]
MSQSSYLTIPVLVFAVYVLYNLVQRLRGSRLPPGPPKLPIIGNALQIPKEREWLTFNEWSKQYGEIMHLSAFGRSIIVLSSPNVIDQLLDKRSAIYSDRPTFQMVGEMMGYSELLPLSPYGTRHRESRKLILTALNSRQASQFSHVHEEKLATFLPRLLRSPEDFRLNIRWLVASIVFQISHGHAVEDFGDPLVQLAERSNHEFSEAIATGAFLVDLVPMLRYVPDWFPGAGFKKIAKRWRKTMERARDEPYDFVKSQLEKGVAEPSFTANLISDSMTLTPEEENMRRCVSSIIYIAGADTTVSAIESFFLAMSLYPDVQRKAQAELDMVLGLSRVPTLADRHRLPYINHLLMEVHRWNPVLPLSLPHKVTQDDVYDDYFIPAGSTIIANTWAILHDASLYPDPNNFVPERYSAKGNSYANPDPRAFVFGYGRRVCPGQSLAEDTLFMVTASTLAMFDIAKPVCPDGSPIEPDVTYTGNISHAAPFACRITPRSKEIQRLVEEMGNANIS